MRLRASHTLVVEPVLPTALEPLLVIARNLYWTWNTDARALFERIDRTRWEASGHNPLRLLQLTPAAELDHLAGDDGFRLHLHRVSEALAAYLSRPARLTVPGTSQGQIIAYFSLEFALTESLPNYSGGLGVLAGDHLKSASDLGLPLVGVGLLYHEGYFQQVLGPDGWQQEEYHEIDAAAQPLRRLRDAAGTPLTIPVPFNGRDVVATVWRLDVGQTPLLLLDTNVEANSAADREISARLYGGDFDMRIQQEILLGIGGVRALHALGLHPAVCHMNEGHSALLGLDRIRMLMEETGSSFEEARLPVTAATVFTTHTAVAAGIDLFPPELIEKHLSHYYSALGMDERTFIGLGRINPADETEPFSMALLGLRLSGYRNGVSKLHRTVSQRLWDSAWPNLPDNQVPIDSITNGVHLPTWVAHEIGELFDRYVGPQWRDDPSDPAQWAHVHDIADQELWDAHERQRRMLITRTREQSRETSARRGLSSTDSALGKPLDPHALTVGFARRFAGYKRATLLFRDPDRLAALVNNRERPVQFIFAGKAHPRDEPAKQLIREVLQFSRRPEFRDRLVLLERYDVDLARSLVQGCDVWLNTPLRPLEASGTSGMKAVANGALHCSVLDGWWYEAFRPRLGWAVGRDRIDDDPEVQDAFDAESLYDLLENEITQSFYERDADGLPQDWLRRMKGSIAEYAPLFNTSRMVSEYAARAYGPAARSWHRLRESQLAPARHQADWLRRVTNGWGSVRVASVEDNCGEGIRACEAVNVNVRVHLGALTPRDVNIDVLYGATSASGELLGTREAPLAHSGQAEDGTWSYAGSFEPGEGGRIGYAVRVLPSHPDLHDPFAAGLVRWA
jgi:starch phosphorylase